MQGADAGVHVPILAESPGPIKVDKHGRGPPLSAPIRRIFYLSAEGTMREHEVFPPPNPRLLQAVNTADAIVYGMGSLYTSICPSLILKACFTPTPNLSVQLCSRQGTGCQFFLEADSCGHPASQNLAIAKYACTICLYTSICPSS